MDKEEFKTSLKDKAVPGELTPALTGLWLDAKGQWEQAHQAVQDDNSRESAWVHAYLHRKEGDISNAGYWYNRAGQDLYEGKLESEWEEILSELIETV